MLYTVGFYLRLTSLSCDRIVQISSWLSFLEGVGNEDMSSFQNFLLLKEQVSFFYLGCEQSRELEKKLNNSSNNKGDPNAMFRKSHSLVLDDRHVDNGRTTVSRQQQNSPWSRGNMGWVRRKNLVSKWWVVLKLIAAHFWGWLQPSRVKENLLQPEGGVRAAQRACLCVCL